MSIFLTDIEMTESPLRKSIDAIYESMFDITNVKSQEKKYGQENKLRKTITPEIREIFKEIQNLMNQKEYQAASACVGGFPIKATNNFLNDIGLEPLPEWHKPEFNNKQAHGISHLIAA